MICRLCHARIDPGQEYSPYAEVRGYVHTKCAPAGKMLRRFLLAPDQSKEE